MAGLKELRTRIATIKSTQKITSAMKMVAAARLRRAQELIAKAEDYNNSLIKMAGRILKNLKEDEKYTGIEVELPLLMKPEAEPKTYLLFVFTSDRGLCGGYNAYVVKETIKRVEELKRQNKEVGIICIGKKAGDVLKNRYKDSLKGVFVGVASKGADYHETSMIISPFVDAFSQGFFDVCEVIYTRFHSAITREVVTQQLLPLNIDIENGDFGDMVEEAVYAYDTEKEKVLADIVPLIVNSTAFQVIVNSQASEHGARMTSMDNATRNASDIISHLTLRYNRLRQTAITTELVEIIAGAEAL